MKKLFLILFVFLFIINGFSQNWTLQQAGTNIGFKSCCFTNINTGYIAGNGMSFKTTNGGVNWFQQTLPAGGSDFMSVYFIDTITGFVIYSFIILKTTDGGNTWTTNYININWNFKSISFFNSNTGCAVGQTSPSEILRTTNCGVNWTEVPYINGSPVTAIYTVPNTGTGYNVNQIGGITKTVNYGSTWTNLQLAHSYTLWSVHFEDINTGYAVGYLQNSPWSNVFLKTTNGGTNWDSSGCGGFLARTLFFTSVNTGYIGCDSGKIFTTTNSGLIWNNQTVTSKNIKSLYFPNAQTGYAVGDSGLILKTTNGGGLTFGSNNQTARPEKYLLYQNYPNPFNPFTNIRFQIKDIKFVTLKVFDVLGKEISTLVNEKLKAGSYEVNFDGSELSSGIYFYILETENYTETKKMLMLK